MRKVIAAINMTLDGFCDHTTGVVDAELHQYYADLVKNAGVMLYGRTTYQLMESYWPLVVKNPTGDPAADDFARAIQDVPKVVFSHTLKSVDWENSMLAAKDIKEEVLALKQQPGKDIYVGSPGLIASLTQLHLIDEFHLCVHPIIAGSGLRLFKNITDQIMLTLLKTKTISPLGPTVLYYAPIKQDV